ncbi:MAG: transporter substrate-binding domain-containing protein [Actinomycetota bacterium]
MRRVVVGLAVSAMLLTACGGGSTTGGGESSSSAAPTMEPLSASSCAAAAASSLRQAGTLTIGTDNPAYPPYYQGGETDAHPDWQFNDPYTGEGFEAAVAYAVAERLGFAPGAVAWTVSPFNQTYKPGATAWDFAIVQISYSEKRAQAVDFSDSYYDVNQALIANNGTPAASATSIADLADLSIAAPIGTTSYDYIVNTIQPTQEAGAFSTLADTVAALAAGQVDAIVVDLPTALYLADPYVQEGTDFKVVGQFATAAEGEYFGMTFETGSPLVACVNLALADLKADGTLQAIQTEWLSQKTNVGEVPVLG